MAILRPATLRTLLEVAMQMRSARMRQLGARHERMPDNRNIPASLGDQILHRSAFALLVGKIHGIHGWRFLACVEQYERAPAVEFGER